MKTYSAIMEGNRTPGRALWSIDHPPVFSGAEKARLTALRVEWLESEAIADPALKEAVEKGLTDKVLRVWDESALRNSALGSEETNRKTLRTWEDRVSSLRAKVDGQTEVSKRTYIVRQRPASATIKSNNPDVRATCQSLISSFQDLG